MANKKHSGKYRINLNAKEIEREVERVKRMRSDIRKSAIDDLNHLARFAEVQLAARIPRDTGDLASSARCTVDASKLTLTIKVGTDHALYVEFGTGIRGLEHQHPSEEWLDEAKWDYNSMVSDHIFLMSDGEPGWIYKDDTGRFRATHGRPASHYFYDTIQAVMDEARRIGVNLYYT